MLGRKRSEIILGCLPLTLKLTAPLQLKSIRIELDLLVVILNLHIETSTLVGQKCKGSYN